MNGGKSSHKVETKLICCTGWDHGIFVPLKLISPPTSIPLIQLSVLSSQSAKDLFALGRALFPLRARGIAIIGSGSAGFHNLHLLFSGGAKDPVIQAKSKVWLKKLDETLSVEDVEERGRLLEGWKQWDGAELMHPRGATEHFSPLVVCAGAGGNGKVGGWRDKMMGLEMGNWYWE